MYYPLVTTVATRGFGNFRGFFNPADRDDAIQTIFVAAFEEKSRLSYNGVDAYTKFLRGIAQNIVRRMLEKRARFNRTDGQPELQYRVVATPEEAVGDAQELRVVSAFRKSIDTEPDKTILHAYFVDGQAEETIAKDIGMTRYKVRKVIADLHKRMTRYLKTHGIT